MSEMKALIQFIFPTAKAILAVVGFIAGLGWGAYAAVSTIAKAEADAVFQKAQVVRSADMEHLNKRFDKLEVMIKELD